jgi:hypothetical protein
LKPPKGIWMFITVPLMVMLPVRYSRAIAKPRSGSWV